MSRKDRLALHMNRHEREGYEAACAEFTAAGWSVEVARGGKHLLVVASGPKADVTLPLCGTPARGQGQSANLARWNARKLIRAQA